MKTALRLALYQPDIPANTGAMMRLCACLGVEIDIIEPCGFPFDDQKLRRAAMDYIAHLTYTRHRSWEDFMAQLGTRRLILLTTKGATPYQTFSFLPDDVLLVGQESAGVPEDVHTVAAARVRIPMHKAVRSLNVGMAASMIMGEALRQTGGLSDLE